MVTGQCVMKDFLSVHLRLERHMCVWLTRFTPIYWTERRNKCNTYKLWMCYVHLKMVSMENLRLRQQKRVDRTFPGSLKTKIECFSTLHAYVYLLFSYVCARVCACVHLNTCVILHMETTCQSPPYLLRQGCSPSCLVCLDWLASKLQESSCPHFPTSGVIVTDTRW